jgi:hypothetical protein
VSSERSTTAVLSVQCRRTKSAEIIADGGAGLLRRGQRRLEYAGLRASRTKVQPGVDISHIPPVGVGAFTIAAIISGEPCGRAEGSCAGRCVRRFRADSPGVQARRSSRSSARRRSRRSAMRSLRIVSIEEPCRRIKSGHHRRQRRGALLRQHLWEIFPELDGGASSRPRTRSTTSSSITTSASLSFFYEQIGLPPTRHSDEVGWNSNNLLEVMYSTPRCRRTSVRALRGRLRRRSDHRLRDLY